jgi:uncharacterized protein (TIGR00725 family)
MHSSMVHFYGMLAATPSSIPLSSRRAPHKPHRPTYTICVSGAAAGSCLVTAKDSSLEVGREIARQGQIIVTGATTGVPYFAAQGAKLEKGVSIGFSPAVSHREHVNKYHLPDDAFDVVVYTGFDYSGRNLLMVRSCDAVIFICGRIGTLNEFTTAFEDDKVIGVLMGSGGITDEVAHIVKISHRGSGGIIYDSNPKRLVDKVIKKVRERDTLAGVGPLSQAQRG